MNRLAKCLRTTTFCTMLLLGVVAAGCNADKDPILGGATVTLAPIVTIENPANGSLGVPIGIPGVSATFNEPVAALTG